MEVAQTTQLTAADRLRIPRRARRGVGVDLEPSPDNWSMDQNDTRNDDSPKAVLSRPVEGWLKWAASDELAEFIRAAAAQVPEFAAFAEREGTVKALDVGDLGERIVEAFVTAKDDDFDPLAYFDDDDDNDDDEPDDDELDDEDDFEDYFDDEDFDDDWDLNTDLLTEIATRATHAPSVELLRAIEAGVTHLRELSASEGPGAAAPAVGAQVLGMLHQQAATGLAESLTREEREKLADWLHWLTFEAPGGGMLVPVAEYDGALDTSAWGRFRSKAAETRRRRGRHESVQRAGAWIDREFAILGRDEDLIRELITVEPDDPDSYSDLAHALSRAGFEDAAQAAATSGFEAMERLSRNPAGPDVEPDPSLADLLAEAAKRRGDLEGAAAVWLRYLPLDPSPESLAAFREAAEEAGTWERDRENVARILAEALSPDVLEFVNELLDRDD